MTKEEVDTFFTKHWADIDNIIKRNAPKSVTKNCVSIASDIYTICVNKPHTLNEETLIGFIGLTAGNIYKWKQSNFNRQNISIANDYEIPDRQIEEDETIDEQIQNMYFILENYYINAEPHEKRLYDLFVKEEVRSIRKLKARTGVTYRGAIVLLREFKQKIQQYERQA